MSSWRTFTAAFLIATMASAAASKAPSQVFAAHDPEGRLPHTTIERLGQIRVDTATFTIFYLTFVNPVSRHGQHRIAIIRNGEQFIGSYQCWLGEGGAKLVIGSDRLVVHEGGLEFVVHLNHLGPTEKAKAFCGEGTGWENSI